MRRLSSRSSTAFAVRNVFSGRKRCGAPPGMMIVRPSCGSSTAALHHPMRAVHDAPLIDAEEVLFYSGNEANEEARTSGHTSFTAAAHAVSSRDVPLAFLDVDELSTYSRAKVINFLKRYRSDTSVKARGEDAFLVEPIAPPPPDDDDDSSSTLYHCAVHLPLRVGELEGLWAHGVASSAKDAEHLAAMHAEYLIDFLGYPIYTLPSMQRKHADAARAAGRPAPYPDEHIMMAPSTAEMPLPMRRIICRDESEGGAWQMMDVDAPPFLSTPHAVLSPCVLDSGAEHRLQQFFRSHGSFLPQHCEVRQDARIDGGGAPMFVASITLPPTILGTNTNKKHNGAVMARGKAPRREVAIQLAAMHAELLLDVLHVPLFPDDDGRQKLHALAAWDVGRPAPLPGAAPKSAEHLCLPLPLKALVLANPPHRVCACSAEESVVLRHRSLASHTTEFLDTLVEESTAVADLQRFLTAHANTTKRIDVDGVVVGARIGNPFFIISLSPGIFRSTVLLPLPEEYGVRGGVGVASKEADANTLAAMHALDVLVALGLWKEGLSETWRHQRATLVGDVPRWASIRAQDASPPGRRHRFGSSWSRAASITDDPTEVVPSSATTTTTTSSPESMRDARVPRRVAKRAHSSNLPEDQRATVAREHWDLSPDTSDGFILVKDRDDGDGDGDAVKKSMALRSPREMDAHAKERLQGFLAAHGRQWSEVFQYSTVDDAHTGLPIHRCAGALPLPSKFGPRVALGEAHTRVAAEHLAAMHAELIVDALGIALFSCVEQQTLHAQASWREGRWALMPSTEHGMDVPDDAQSPPPLRRVNEDGDVVPMIAKTPRHRPRHVRRPPTTTTTSAASSSSAAKEEAVLMELDQLDYTDVTADEVDVVAKARVEYFLRHHAKNTPIQRTSTTVLHKGVLHHMVKWPLPLPTPSGAILHVWVEGCAPTKREAECAAWMHAERTLDALQIPIFGNLPGLQRWHAQRVAALGRSAPTCITAAVVDAHVDRNPVRPLRCCVSMDAPPLRPPPTLVGDGDDAWMAYVEDCRQYVDERRMHSANAFLSREEVPRCGEALVDGALDAMEKLPISVDAKAQLHRYCHEAGTSFPTAWPTTFAGPLVHRVCWCSIVVPGFSHLMAHGVGPNKDAAQRRAAMHAMALLKVVDENYAANEMAAKARVEESTSAESSNVVGDASVMQNRDDVAEEPQQPSMLVRRGRRSRQSAGTADSTESVKQRLVELFSICLDVAPPRVLRCTTRQHKEDGFISFTHHVRVEVVDEDGKVWAGRGEGDGIRANTRAAFAAVHAALATGHPLMAAVEELRRKHAWLRPEKIATLTLTEAQQQHIKTMVQNLPDDREVELEELPPPGMEELAPMEEGCGPSAAMTASEVAQKSHELQERLFRRIVSEVYLTNFAKKRESLSIFCHRDAILASIKTHQVTIICGTTGCGKTTQVPQYILDDLTEEGNGGACSIAISQPRRLSAVSIAQRVATERLEVLGQSCGYRIRFDARPGTHINFCTTGILLRMLRSSPTLTGISHIIIDEIHERDINSDFLLVLLRQLIRVRPDVRLILMSATLQSEAFGRYFAGANIIHIEGYNYPVEELFLEDLVPLAETHKVVTPWLKEASRTMQHDTKAASMCVVDPNTRTPSSSSSSSSTKYGVMEATSEIDVATLQFAVEQAARMVNLHSSSVLVFLPGWDDIMQAKNMLERNPAYDIIALHSSVGAEEQMRCFLPAKEGKKKIILATNIAESGITIDDVAAVVDVGRVKEKTNMRHHHRRGEAGGNTHSSISQLLTVYASKANCIQRRGRVGRTRPGVCIRLYTRQHFRELHEFQTPEMLRTPLDGICLQVLALKLGDPLIFLQNAMEPPSQELVEASMARLMQLGAVSRTRQLTALGVRLAALPTDPRMAKMMLMGCIFRCLDTALTIAATNDGDVFLPTREHRDAVRLHREDLAQGTQSDAMAAVNAYNLWVAATQRNEAGSVLADLEDRQLSLTRLVAVTRAKKQFYSLLLASGFIGHDEDALIGPTSAVSRVPRECCVEHSSYSEDAQHAGVVRTVMASSLLPQVAAFTGKRKLATKSEQDVLPHGDSVLHHTPEDEVLQPYFLYAEMTRSQESRKLYVRGLTSISLWSVLLMNPMDVAITYCPDLHVVVVDEWLVCRASFAVVESLRKLRRALHAALTRKFADPTNEENNARLEEMRVFIKDLVSMSIQPNAMATSPWIDRGIIWSPTAAPVAPPPPPPTTTTAAISSSLEDPHTSTTE